jgi:hypothetical protein
MEYRCCECRLTLTAEESQDGDCCPQCLEPCGWEREELVETRPMSDLGKHVFETARLMNEIAARAYGVKS